MNYKVTFKDGTIKDVEAFDKIEAKYKAILIKYKDNIMSNIVNVVDCYQLIEESDMGIKTIDCTTS